MLFKCAEMATGKTTVARIAPRSLQCQARGHGVAWILVRIQFIPE
jgi:DNA polymerase III gamma/tau subunit